jgi:aryl-alcohol dehydrogenase-like predicted oxidoreductase
LQLLEDKRIGVFSRGGLAKGLLVDKPPKDYLHYSSEDVEKFQRIIKGIDNSEIPTSRVALGFVLNKSVISSAVIGIRKMEQLEDVLKASNSQTLTSEELKMLNDAIAPNYFENHR